MAKSYRDRHCQQSSNEDVEMILDGSRVSRDRAGTGRLVGQVDDLAFCQLLTQRSGVRNRPD